MFGPASDLRANIVKENTRTRTRVNRYSDDLTLCDSTVDQEDFWKASNVFDKKSKGMVPPEYPQNQFVNLSPLFPLLHE